MTTHLFKKKNNNFILKHQKKNFFLLDEKKAIIGYMFDDCIHNRSFGPLNTTTKIEYNIIEYKHIDKKN